MARPSSKKRSRGLAPRSTEPVQVAPRDIRKDMATLVEEYRTLSETLAASQLVMTFQANLLSACNYDEIFRTFFVTYARQTERVFGVSLLAEEDHLRLAGRFGYPRPDSYRFCELLAAGLEEDMQVDYPSFQIEPAKETWKYEYTIQKYLPGMTVLVLPLRGAHQTILGGLLLYRKGEQPFTSDDVELAELLAFPTALAVERNARVTSSDSE